MNQNQTRRHQVPRLVTLHITQEEILDGIQVALSNNLYMVGGLFIDIYVAYTCYGTERYIIHHLGLIYRGSIPVGVCVVWNHPEDNEVRLSCYVDPTFRRQGYGTNVVKAVLGSLKMDPKTLYYTSGLNGHKEFWRSIPEAKYPETSRGRVFTHYPVLVDTG